MNAMTIRLGFFQKAGSYEDILLCMVGRQKATVEVKRGEIHIVCQMGDRHMAAVVRENGVGRMGYVGQNSPMPMVSALGS